MSKEQTQFEELTTHYEDLKKKFLDSRPELKKAIADVQEIFDFLEKTPDGRGYMDLDQHTLLGYEFQLARMNEFLGVKAAEVEGLYTYFHDKYKQEYLIKYRENKRQLNMKENKVTVSDIDSLTVEELAEFQDKVNVLYEYSRYLKSMVESIGQFLIALTHRIKSSQSEMPFSSRNG